jgi:hypothetical protein
MATLTSKTRNSLPSSSFGIPGKRKYPMEDASHAANAKARASQQEGRGAISKSTEESIDAKADRVLGKKKKKPLAAHMGAQLMGHRDSDSDYY